jgi:hypothetical protein
LKYELTDAEPEEFPHIYDILLTIKDKEGNPLGTAFLLSKSVACTASHLFKEIKPT